MLNLVVEGWRFYPQSFSIVNQFQCLELLKRKDVRLYHREMPPPPLDMMRMKEPWKPEPEILDARDAKALAAIPEPPRDLKPDAVLRMIFPHDFSAAPAGRTFVFAVTGRGRLPNVMNTGRKPMADLLAGQDVTLVTPSPWSKQALVASGAKESQVSVVPHGVDTNIFRPLEPARRAALRKEFGWEGSFIFLNVAGLFWWKGTAVLVKAFAAIAARRPEAQLVIKGVDSVYASEIHLKQLGQDLSPAERAAVEKQARYYGGSLGYARLAEVYGAADALILPYVNEGFCLPALEAMACGLPVVCTQGGPTDDFLSDEVALRIESVVTPPGEDATRIKLKFPSVVAQMLRAMDDKDLPERARKLGPALAANWTWQRATDRLAEVLSGAA